MKKLLALLCMLPLFAFAQTITVYPNANGLDSNGSAFGVIQNNLAVGKLTSFYFYEYVYEPGLGYDYSHYIVGSVGNADWQSSVNTIPAVVYDTSGKPHNGVMGSLHAQWSGTDNQGLYPGTPVPGQFFVDATYTAYTYCGGGGRGGGYCHYIVQWAAMTVTINGEQVAPAGGIGGTGAQ